MSNKRIECEWCGTYYSIEKYEKCPSCGGQNEKIQEEQEPAHEENIKPEPETPKYESSATSATFRSFHFETQKSNTRQNKANEKKKHKKRSILFSIMIPLCLVVFSLFRFADVIEESTSPSSTRPLHAYYTDEDITLDTNTLSIEGISFEDSWSSSSDCVYPKMYLHVSEDDLSKHIVDFYFMKGNQKYRYFIDSYSLEDVKSVNDILKYKAIEYVSGKVETEADFDFTTFDALLVEIDNQQYKLALDYKALTKGGKYQGEEKYTISEKIKFDGDNILYIDSIGLSPSTYNSYTSVTLSLSNNITTYSNHELDIYVEYADQRIYELFPTSYFSSNFTNENDLLSSKITAYDAHCNMIYYTNEKDPVAFIFVIDGNQTRIALN